MFSHQQQTFRISPPFESEKSLKKKKTKNFMLSHGQVGEGMQSMKKRMLANHIYSKNTRFTTIYI